MLRTLAILPILLGAAPAQEGTTSVPAILDAMAAIGRIRWKNGGDGAPCIYLRTPSGDTIVAAHSATMGSIKPGSAPFEAVFRSDAPQPKSVAATLLAQGESLAWFKLEGEAPVKPVEIRHVPGLRRGGTLYIAGVKMIGHEITVNQLTLGVANAVRYDDRQECMFLRCANQVRDLKPMALLDSQGRLAALYSRDRPVTPTDILDSIEGTVVSTTAQGLKDEGGRLKGKLVLDLCNPLGRMKGVTALLLQKHLVKEFARTPDATGRWPALGAPAAEVKIAIEGNQGTVDLDVPMDAAKERYWAFQYRVARGDGSVRHSSWTFIDGRRMAEGPHFTRYVEEPPHLRAPVARGAAPKLANIVTGAPVATGISLLSRIEVVRGAQIAHSVEMSGSKALCWSSDYRHVYLLDGQNVVRKIAMPEMREVCEFGVGFECSDLRRSAEGPVVLVKELNELWVLSSGNLSVRTRIPLGDGTGVMSMGENASTAWVSLGGELLAVDLGAGRIAKRHTDSSLGAGAAKAVRPEKAGTLQISNAKFKVSPNGRYLVILGHQNLHRFSVNGFNLAYEEISPAVQDSIEDLLFSPDSYYVVARTSGRSTIYRTLGFESPVVEYSRVRVVGFDKAAGVLYGRSIGSHRLSVLRADGIVERTLDTIASGNEALVHPDGSKVLLVGHDLSLVELFE